MAPCSNGMMWRSADYVYIDRKTLPYTMINLRDFC